MKNILVIIVAIGVLISCNNSKKGKQEIGEDKRIMLRTDTLNMVKMTDTLVIYESTCRGCAYESSTNFSISDSSGVVELNNVETNDSNNDAKESVAGGSIRKTLVIVPKKTGYTKIKLYKFWQIPGTATDSANFTSYSIEVKN